MEGRSFRRSYYFGEAWNEIYNRNWQAAEATAMSVTLSLSEARRLAIASQGFATRLPAPSVADLRKLAGRLHAFQIDSVTVLVRAHYFPAFARLGPYRTETLDSLAYRKRELFEYWGHEACPMCCIYGIPNKRHVLWFC